MPGSRHSYAAADVLARVETVKRGDRIYLPGFGTSDRGRVVASVELEAGYSVGEYALPPAWRIVYYTGELSRPSDSFAAPRELVRAGLRPFPAGERIRVRRLITGVNP